MQDFRRGPVNVDVITLKQSLMSNAIYFLIINGSQAAELSDPRFGDMFWWDYQITPTDEASDAIIRDPYVWETVNFSIVDADNRQPNTLTFSGGYNDFCDGLTDRLSFRSLPPPDAMRKPNWAQRFWRWIANS